MKLTQVIGTGPSLRKGSGSTDRVGSYEAGKDGVAEVELLASGACVVTAEDAQHTNHPVVLAAGTWRYGRGQGAPPPEPPPTEPEAPKLPEGLQGQILVWLSNGQRTTVSAQDIYGSGDFGRVTIGTIRTALSRLAKGGHLQRQEKGVYVVPG